VEGTTASAADAALAGQEALLPMIWQQLPGGRMVPVPLQSPVRVQSRLASVSLRASAPHGRQPQHSAYCHPAARSHPSHKRQRVRLWRTFLRAGRRAAVFHGEPANRRRAVRRCHAACANALDAVCQPLSGEISICST
jgi:hypothetical protein